MSDFIAKRRKMDEENGNRTQINTTLPKKTCDWYTQKFAEIVNLPTFVDKTLFIKAFLQESRCLVVLAPRGFGKSTNMDMVREFVSGNRKLFEDNKLKIYEEEREFFMKNCKENPVIHVDFKNVGGQTKEEVRRSMKTVIQGAYDDHKYLVKKIGENYSWADERLKSVWFSVNSFVRNWKEPETSYGDVDMAWETLSKILHTYYGKHVYVFIDSYDAPIIQTLLQTEPNDDVVNTTSKLIDRVMHRFLDNKHVKKVLMNACVETWEDVYAIKYNKFLGAFAPYFGFTDDEVKALFQRDEFVAFKNDDEILKWYSGYRTEHTNIYRSYSIIQYLDRSRKMNRPQFNTYWTDSDNIPNLTELFTIWGIRRNIEELIHDEEIKILTKRKLQKSEIMELQSYIHHPQTIICNTDAHNILLILSDHGYLNAGEARYNSYHYTTLRVPNQEIKKLLQEKCYNAEFFEQKYQLRPTKIREYVEALCSLLQQKDKNAFIRFASSVSELFDGALLPNKDYEFDSILFTLLYNFKLYKVQSELRVQRVNYLNTLVALGDVQMIIKFECNYSSSEMAQILVQQYDAINKREFKDYRDATSKIFSGLHMNEDRKVSLTYTVDDSAKQTVTSND